MKILKIIDDFSIALQVFLEHISATIEEFESLHDRIRDNEIIQETTRDLLVEILVQERIRLEKKHARIRDCITSSNQLVFDENDQEIQNDILYIVNQALEKKEDYRTRITHAYRYVETEPIAHREILRHALVVDMTQVDELSQKLQTLKYEVKNE